MDYIIGAIMYMPWNRPMYQFLQCRGQVLEIQHHEALFSLLGNRYGGDGVHNFALPDLRPWDDSGPDYGKRSRREWHENELVAYICTEGLYPQWD